MSEVNRSFQNEKVHDSEPEPALTEGHVVELVSCLDQQGATNQ